MYNTAIRYQISDIRYHIHIYRVIHIKSYNITQMTHIISVAMQTFVLTLSPLLQCDQ